MANGVLSADFQISKGTKQDCLLSLLLFIIALETFAERFCGNKQIKEILYKLKWYAYNVILIIIESQQTIKQLMKKNLNFGEFSGYRINIQK